MQTKGPPTLSDQLNVFTHLLRSKSAILERTITQHGDPNEYFPAAEIEPASSFIILPESFLKVSWDILTTLIVLYQSFMYPLYFAFGMANEGYYLIDIAFTVIFSADIILNFNCAFYRRGALITNRKAIAKKYLKFWLWIDLASTFPYGWVFDGDKAFSDSKGEEVASTRNLFYSSPALLRMLKITRIMSLLRLAKFRKKLREFEYFLSSSQISTFLMAFRLLIMMVIVGHWIACLWVFISYDDYENCQTWLTNSDLGNETKFDIYISAMYWSLASMSSVGYGDIKALNMGEKFVSIICVVIGSGIFTFIVSNIGTLVSKQASNANDHRERVVKFNSFMQNNEVPPELKFKVRRYMDYLWEKREVRMLHESEFLELLSDPLRDAIFHHTRGKILQGCKILSQLCSGQVLLQMSRIFEPRVYAPNDIICEQNERSSEMHFVLLGIVEVLHESTKTVFANLSPDACFGQISFFTLCPRKASVRCLEFVETLSLNRVHVDNLAERFPELGGTLKEIRLKCEEGDLSEIDVVCYMCGVLGHAAIDCKRVVLNANADSSRDNWLKGKIPKPVLVNPFTVSHEPNYIRTDKRPSRQRTVSRTGRFSIGKKLATSASAVAFKSAVIPTKVSINIAKLSPEEALKRQLAIIMSEDEANSDEELS